MFSNPVFFGVEIQWFSFFHWLGVLIGYGIGIWHYRKHSKGYNSVKKMAFLLLMLMPIALLGSRVPGIIERYVATGNWPPMAAFFWGPAQGMFRWCGTLLVFILLLPSLARFTKTKNFPAIFDSLAIALCPLTALVKQGCFFSGDGCYGIATTLPWGMHFAQGAAPSLLPVHPTPLYDSIFHFALFGLLFFWDKRKAYEGQTAIFYFTAASIFYILLEIIRINPRTAIGLTVPQITYCLVLVGTGFYYWSRKKDGYTLGH